MPSLSDALRSRAQRLAGRFEFTLFTLILSLIAWALGSSFGMLKLQRILAAAFAISIGALVTNCRLFDIGLPRWWALPNVLMVTLWSLACGHFSPAIGPVTLCLSVCVLQLPLMVLKPRGASRCM
jgi:hypothetical protein